MKWSKISPERISDNVFHLIGHEWMLITAGTPQKYNMMTASWGGLGILWNKPVAFIFVRPTRYTYEFLNQTNEFSLNFFSEKYRDVLKMCGSKSGRDINKMTESKLTPMEKHQTIYFAESRVVFLCKKIYFQDLNPANFLSPEIEKNYSANDYHRMYIGEIIESGEIK